MHKDLEKVVSFRAVEPGDISFILDSWIKSYRTSPWAGVVPNHKFFDVTHEVIEELLTRGAVLSVACATHDPTRILGWACTEHVTGGVACHYVYVKDPFRRMGLATELLKRNVPQTTPDRKFYTFRTRASSYFRDWVHAPEIARRKS